MRYYFLSVFFICFLTASLQTHAQDEEFILTDNDRDALFTAAEGFADCAGAYEAFSKAVIVLDKIDNFSIVLHEMGLGAAVSGSWLLAKAGVIKDWQKAQAFVNERKESATVNWFANLEDLSNPNYVETFSKLSEKTVWCKENYGEVQNELVKEVTRIKKCGWNYTR
ncbi:MAG: hypothetical protein H6855_06580 [Rhodospirillales bacterium]|nr:hypothetical protein [Rhodospirillales bacterium]